MFPTSLSQRLDTFAAKQGKAMADIVREAVDRAIADNAVSPLHVGPVLDPASLRDYVQAKDVEGIMRALLKPEMLRDVEEVNLEEAEAEQQPRPALSPLPEKYRKLVPSHLPVYKLAGQVTAGGFREAIEEPQFLTARDLLEWQNDDEDFLLEINPDDGESLQGDGIAPGDYVHIRSTSEAHNGDIVLVIGQDEGGQRFATLKHWHRRGNRVELRPSNPKSKTINAHVSEVEIHGVVINAIKRNFKRTRKK